MAAPKRGPRLGAGPKHQRLMLANLASELFVHGRIQTTETKAKNLRPYAEKLITKAKQGDLHARRQVLSKLRDRDVVAYLFEEVAPRFQERNGGYTRILKLGPRKGDGASMALIELTELGAFGEGEDFVEEGRARRARGLFGRLRRGGGGGDGDAGVGVFEDEDLLEDEDVEELGEAEVADQVDVEPEELAEETGAGEPDPLAEVADEDSPVDSLAEATEDTAADTPAVDEDPAEGGPPDDPTIGEPVDETGDDADAGEASGKDAGS